MRLALLSREEGGRDPSAWAVLPGLCCQAAGGEFSWADPLAAAWLLFYTAAHLMDSLEDQDEPDPWWREQGPPAALHTATGLFFSAGLALQELADLPVDPRNARKAGGQILRPFLRMSSGQYAEYLHPPRSLDDYWRVAAAKSGAFFALACQSGAVLAGASPDQLEGYEQFGLNAGLMVQILDDLGDFKDLSRGCLPSDRRSAALSLPSIYIREVCPPEVSTKFDRILAEGEPGASAAEALTAIIEANGGVLYLLTELNLRHGRALEGLDAAGARQPTRNMLAALLSELNTASG